MFGLALLAGLFALGMAAFMFAAMFVVRVIAWVVFLPFRLVFMVLALPFLLLKIVFAAVGLLIFLVMLAAGGLMMLVGLAALALPLLPIALLFVFIWALFRLMRPAAAA